MINQFIKLVVICLKKTEILSAVSCRLVKLTHKHPDPVHPKHLVIIRTPWYLNYLKKSDRVLDIGCNNGQHTIKIARISYRVDALDYDRNALKLAKNEVQRCKLKHVHFKYANAEKKLPYSSNTFEVVTFFDVFEHLYNRSKILQEVKRVLKTRGRLLISVPNRDTRWKRIQYKYGLFYFSDPDHKIEFSKSEIRKLLVNEGFKVKKISPVTLDTPLVGFIDLIGGFSLSLYSRIARWRRNIALNYPDESIGFEIFCTVT